MRDIENQILQNLIPLDRYRPFRGLHGDQYWLARSAGRTL